MVFLKNRWVYLDTAQVQDRTVQQLCGVEAAFDSSNREVTGSNPGPAHKRYSVAVVA